MARLLFFSSHAPIGGHLRSALTIAKALSDRGHELSFVTSEGPGLELVINSGIDYLVLPHLPTSGGDMSLRNFVPLLRICKHAQPAIIHSFMGGILELSLIARFCNVPLIATICGGKPHRIFPRMQPVIVFSGELADWLTSIGIPSTSVHVIPARMNLAPEQADEEVNSFAKAHGVSRGLGPIVMMVCRADATKIAALNIFFEAAQSYGKRNQGGLFLHIGKGNCRETEEYIRKQAEDVNSKVGRRILISTSDGSHHPSKFLNLATFVVGMGRSAFEGMALGKPTLVLSNEGFAGPVQQQTIGKIAHFNFTARGTQGSGRMGSSARLGETLEYLIHNPDVADEAASFGRTWLEENMDVNVGAAMYEDVYQSALGGGSVCPGASEILKFLLYRFARRSFYRLKGILGREPGPSRQKLR
ncbi:MAG: glycosyltransferase [Thermodesulfobacteriota bacterium]|nr:glycosyltransferase [Thermodesulfobacteriota bacterium]